ncbi:MAG: hypothetical protein IT495_16960 [Gammaproteobacteria bacterium]|nr:hypothetical protein [Gammaproteobacteria bacterium]
MSQHDFDIANAAGASVRADLNSALQALVSLSSGAAEPGTTYAYQLWADTSAGALKVRNGANNAWVTIGTLDQANLALLPLAGGILSGDLELGSAAHLVATPMPGQCYFEYTSATVCTLKPFQGHLVPVKTGGKWKLRKLPSGGITLATGGLSANTTYYVYVYDASGTLTLEVSATGHATDTSIGVEIKSGDATRTLVGMVRTNGSSQFDVTPKRIGVLSWFNRRARGGRNKFASTRSTSSTSAVEINTEIRIEFLAWEESVNVQMLGRVSNATAPYGAYAYPNIDGTSLGQVGGHEGTNAHQKSGSGGAVVDVSEGWHYATIFGNAGTSGTVTLYHTDEYGLSLQVRG